MTVSINDLSPVIIEIIKSGTRVNLTITGNSMLPLWHHRKDSVVLTSCDPKNLKKYDIPLYQRENGQFVIHRIVKVHKDSFDIVGDAQTYIEKGVQKSSVIAVVEQFTRKGKTVKCDSIGYKIYSVIWCAVRPLRGVIFKLYSLLRKKK